MRKVWRFLKIAAGVALALAVLAAIGIGAWLHAVLRAPVVAPAAYEWPRGIDDAEVERLAADLVSRMTLEEKLHEMSGNGIWPMVAGQIVRGAAAPVLAGGNARLGLPPISFTDGPRGVAIGHSTSFPVAMARAATWDVALERRVGDAIGKEARAQNANYFGGVCINLVRHPSMGRAQETYGEDPWLMGEMAVALVDGVQHHNVMACAKHFALNSMETKRYSVDVTLDERTLREVYLPHFRKVVEHGVASIMSAYNKVRGEYAGQNRYLLTKVLREDWGFRGFVTSDWMQGLYDGLAGVRAGLDVEMPAAVHYGDELRRLVEEGRVPESEIDASLLRNVRTRLRYVTREDPIPYPETLVASEEHRALAREVAEKGAVLLRNEGELLPLDLGSTARIAMVGRLIEEDNTGDRGSSKVAPPYVVTPLEGLLRYVGERALVSHADGSDLGEVSRVAADADVVVAVVGVRHDEDGEYITMDGSTPSGPGEKRPTVIETPFGKIVFSGGDRVPLSLVEADRAVVEAAISANPRTVVVLIGGSAITMEGWRDRVPAILMAWYFGMEGGNALPRLLFGDIGPSGRLPITIPRDESQLPPFDEFADAAEYGYYHGYTLLEKQREEPAFAFGFGLSYTHFSYDSLTLARARVPRDGVVEASVRVTNAGDRPGEEVVQLYVGFEGSPVDRPVKLLRGFRKLALAAGETQRVSFELPVKELARYDPEAGAWVVDPMRYQLFAGGSSRAADLLEAGFWVDPPGL